LNWIPSKGDEDEEKLVHGRAGVLKEHQSGSPMAELCRRRGISDATFPKLAQPLWRHGSLGRPATEEPRGQESEAEEAAGGLHAGRRMPRPRGSDELLDAQPRPGYAHTQVTA